MLQINVWGAAHRTNGGVLAALAFMMGSRCNCRSLCPWGCYAGGNGNIVHGVEEKVVRVCATRGEPCAASQMQKNRHSVLPCESVQSQNTKAMQCMA